jgi:hypothetical protein
MCDTGWDNFKKKIALQINGSQNVVCGPLSATFFVSLDISQKGKTVKIFNTLRKLFNWNNVITNILDLKLRSGVYAN